MNIIGLDIGKKKTGICLFLEGICIPSRTIHSSQISAVVKELAEEYAAELIVIGVPLADDGSETEMSAEIRTAAETALSCMNIRMEFFNERYSSKEAGRKIADSGIDFNDDDSISACIILEDYLNEKKQKIQN